ncbi:hypothetical protein JHK87_040991 [Glycine soja]|nr:hypothetical protein JHK87_040991 [Glycine soja]
MKKKTLEAQRWPLWYFSSQLKQRPFSRLEAISSGDKRLKASKASRLRYGERLMSLYLTANLRGEPGDKAAKEERCRQAHDAVSKVFKFRECYSVSLMNYDGLCNLCNGCVKFVRDNDRNKTIRYESLQSEAGKLLLRRSGKAPDDISSVVLVEKERSFIKSEAVLKIMEYIDLPFPQLAILLQFVPLFIRDFVYDNVANNRYQIFGRSESCEI